MGKIFTVLAATIWAVAILTIAVAEESENEKAGDPQPAVDLASSLKTAREANRKILESLQKPVEFKLQNATWETLAAEITRLTHVPVQLGEESASILQDANEWLICDYKDIPLDTALAWLLEPRDYAWCVKDEVLFLLPRKRAGERCGDFQVHNLASLVKAGYKAEELYDAVVNFTPGPWEEVDGDGGKVDQRNETLIVKHASNVQQRIVRLVDMIQIAAEEKDAAGAIYGIDAADARVFEALKQKIDVAYEQTPLADVVSDLQTKLKVPIHLDVYGLKVYGIPFDRSITLKASKISAESVLDLILPVHELSAEVHKGRLLITTPDVSLLLQQPFIHDISDFINAKFSADDVIDAVVKNSRGPWESVGGDGAADPQILNSKLMIVTQTSRGHRDVALLLDDLRTKYVASKLEALKKEPPPDPNALRTEVYTELPDVFQELMGTIPVMVAPETWKQNGGKGLIQRVGKTLVIQQTNAVHDEIRAFLTKLKESTKPRTGPMHRWATSFVLGNEFTDEAPLFMKHFDNAEARRERLHFDRRRFLSAGMAGLAGLSLPAFFPSRGLSFEASAMGRDFTIEKIDRTTVRVPYREIPERAMDRELPHWRYSEVFEIHLKSGHVGFGETLLYYTWGATEDDDVTRAMGKNAASLMWDDSLGAGLQMAILDAVAKAADVPIYRLLGTKVHDKTPLSWWNIDMPPEDMAAECREAFKQGYMAYKTKGRPWFDLFEQLEQSTKGLPDAFKIDMDFNDTLRTAEQAIPVLKQLELYPQVDIFETPIPQGDIEGNKKIREATRVKVAMHYGIPEPVVAIKEEVCDGFIIGGGATRVMEQGHVAAMADKPFWLQLVGTGLTAAFSLHFGAVLSHAKWPAVNCHQLFTHNLLTAPIVVKDGFAAVPEKPGLGYELDRKALEQFKVEKPTERPDPPRLLRVTWPNGRMLLIGNTGQVNFMLDAANNGTILFYRPGVKTEVIPNDGSAGWTQRWERARKNPIVMMP